MLLLRREDHARDARIDREFRELPADARELVALVDRAQLGEQLVAVGDHARTRRIEERKVLDVADLERLHAQDHARERRAQDLGIGELRARRVIVFGVQADAHAGGHASAAARALIGRCARNPFDLQLLDLVAVAVAVDAREPGVDHVADARHRQRRFSDVGRQHDAPPAVGAEHAVLLFERHARIQRQDFGARRMVLAQRFGGFTDFALAGQEHENIAACRDPRQLAHRVDDRLLDILVFLFLALAAERTVTHFDRIQAP